METQSSNILIWENIAIENDHLYFLDVCDCFNYEHFPVFVKTQEELFERKKFYNELDQHRVYGGFFVENGKAKELF